MFLNKNKKPVSVWMLGFDKPKKYDSFSFILPVTINAYFQTRMDALLFLTEISRRSNNNLESWYWVSEAERFVNADVLHFNYWMQRTDYLAIPPSFGICPFIDIPFDANDIHHRTMVSKPTYYVFYNDTTKDALLEYWTIPKRGEGKR